MAAPNYTAPIDSSREGTKPGDQNPQTEAFKVPLVISENRPMSAFKKKLLEQISRELIDVPDEQLRDSDAETPEDAAHRFIATRRVLNEWDEAVGPFYDTAGLTKWLGKNHRMNLQHQVDRGEILTVRAGRSRLYPTFQFSSSGQPLPGLSQVLEVLSKHLTDPWERALWLNSPIEDAAGGSIGYTATGTTAAALLRDGRVDEVVQVAEEDVDRWAQ